MMYDYLLPGLHLIFILKRKHFPDLICHVQGELFSIQAAQVSALHVLEWEKTLPLTTLESYLGLKLEGGFIRESPYTIMGSVKCCFSQSHPPLWGPWPFPRWSEGRFPMGSPYFRLALQAEITP